MRATEKDIDFHHWVVENLPYAFHENPDLEYSKQDYESAKACFLGSSFFVDNVQYLYQAFAALIRSIHNRKEQFPEAIKNGKVNEENNKKLMSIEQVRTLIGTGEEFEIIVRRKNTNEKYFFSEELIYKLIAPTSLVKEAELEVLLSNAPLALERKEKMEATTLKKHMTIYREEIAYIVFASLSKMTDNKSEIYPIIGNLFNETEMSSFYSSTDDNGVIKFNINRGQNRYNKKP